MKVLFINYYDFRSNSATHIFNLANGLVQSGFECAVAVPKDKETITVLGVPQFACLDFEELEQGGVSFKGGGGPDLVVAWTPRENVRIAAESVVARYRCPYTVHLEDNEDLLTAAALGLNPDSVLTVPARHYDHLTGSAVAHPYRMRAFLAKAAGVTVIVERLTGFCAPGTPTEIIWPGYDEGLFDTVRPDPALRDRLGVPKDACLLAYPGNVHAANAEEMRSLYLAIAVLNREGLPVRLLRLGQNFVDFLGPVQHAVKDAIHDLGYRPHLEIAQYLMLADVLVQPGRPDRFNDFRIPSKLPEFLITGRPVILPATNIGLAMTEGENCLLLHEGHCLEIAARIRQLIEQPARAAAIGEGGKRFAQTQLNWRVGTAKLKAFLERVVSGR